MAIVSRRFHNIRVGLYSTNGRLVFLLMFLTPYYVTRDLPDRNDFSVSYQNTTYDESERIKKELGGTSLEPHSISGPWRKSPSPSEEPQLDNN